MAKNQSKAPAVNNQAKPEPANLNKPYQPPTKIPAANLEKFAQAVAFNHNGVLLRWRFEEGTLIVLLVDGRKYYSTLGIV